MDTANRLDNIISRLEQLQHKMVALQVENTDLLKENQELKQQLAERSEAPPTAENHISEHALEELAAARDGVRATLDQDIRQQIDHYLTEIDRCIEWLGEQ